MQTFGFVASNSDLIVNDVAIPAGKVGYHLYVGGGGGDIVWENAKGEYNYIHNAALGSVFCPGLVKVLSSGEVNGTVRTTGATGLTCFYGNYK